MGPISKVRRLFLPLVYSNDKVDMQLNHIKRVDDDKVKLTALVTVKYANKYVTEYATLIWNAKIKAFSVKSNGVNTNINDLGYIKVKFSINKLNLNTILTLKINKLITHLNKLIKEVDIVQKDLNIVEEDLNIVEEDVKELKEDHEELDEEFEEEVKILNKDKLNIN